MTKAQRHEASVSILRSARLWHGAVETIPVADQMMWFQLLRRAVLLNGDGLCPPINPLSNGASHAP